MKQLFFMLLASGSLFITATTLTTTVFAADQEMAKGWKLAKEMDIATSGYKDYRANATMHLINRKGQESLREMSFRTLETANDGDKSMVVFDRPRDIKGFAALTYAHKIGSDDQWMYLPKLHRVKRISSVNQAGPFVGSEFAYEDIGSQELEQYTYKYVGESQHEGIKTSLLERYPVDPNSGYSKQIVWIDKSRKIPLRIDYYDRKGQLLKELNYKKLRLYKNRFWKPDQVVMTNKQIGKKTIVDYREYVFHTGLSAKKLSVEALKRLR